MESSVLYGYAYDPLKTTICFDGHKVTGSASGKKYVRVNAGQHELHLQVTSEFLQKISKGHKGSMTIVAHAGGDRSVSVNCGVLCVEDIYIKELTTGVPEVVVVLKKF